MKNCKHCGYTGDDFIRKSSGPHIGEYCPSCGKWLKWEKQPGNEGKTKEDYKNEYLDKQPATEQQQAYIKNLLKQNPLSKYKASRIIEILGGEPE